MFEYRVLWQTIFSNVSTGEIIRSDRLRGTFRLDGGSDQPIGFNGRRDATIRAIEIRPDKTIINPKDNGTVIMEVTLPDQASPFYKVGSKSVLPPDTNHYVLRAHNIEATGTNFPAYLEANFDTTISNGLGFQTDTGQVLPLLWMKRNQSSEMAIGVLNGSNGLTVPISMYRVNRSASGWYHGFQNGASRLPYTAVQTLDAFNAALGSAESFAATSIARNEILEIRIRMTDGSFRQLAGNEWLNLPAEEIYTMWQNSGIKIPSQNTGLLRSPQFMNLAQRFSKAGSFISATLPLVRPLRYLKDGHNIKKPSYGLF